MIGVRTLSACGLALTLAACAAAAPPAGGPAGSPQAGASLPVPPDAVRWTIGPGLVPCTGVAPGRCMQYRDAPGGPWKNHYGPIEGFEFRPGQEADVLVRFVPVPNPPADGASRRVVLVRELDRRAAMPAAVLPPALAGSAWRLVEMPGTAPPIAGPRGAPTLAFDAGGRASGLSGVNRYSAGTVADATALRFANAVTTRMAGTPEAMALETAFLTRLQQTTAWRVDGDRLLLLDATGAPLMRFERMPAAAGS
jgi:heat shock protein HslJ